MSKVIILKVAQTAITMTWAFVVTHDSHEPWPTRPIIVNFCDGTDQQHIHYKDLAGFRLQQKWVHQYNDDRPEQNGGG